MTYFKSHLSWVTFLVESLVPVPIFVCHEIVRLGTIHVIRIIRGIRSVVLVPDHADVFLGYTDFLIVCIQISHRSMTYDRFVEPRKTFMTYRAGEYTILIFFLAFWTDSHDVPHYMDIIRFSIP